MRYKDKDGNWKELSVKASDTLPIGTIVEYDGTEVPSGYEVVEDSKVLYETDDYKTYSYPINLNDNPLNYKKIVVYGIFKDNIARGIFESLCFPDVQPSGTLNIIAFGGAYGGIYSLRYNFSSTQLTKSNDIAFEGSNGSINKWWGNGENVIVTKVVGYK